MSGDVTGFPRALLRAEGAITLAVATALYAVLETGAVSGWWVFAVLILAPDLSMLGYLGGPRTGAVVYNLAHSHALPLALIGLGVIGPVPAALGLGLIWAAHIGIDRALGYGLKYPDGFGHTHLGRIGKDARD
ncbi:DUF4260 domain-containing protein [Halodurantibacterium flavum]|uniref:DUF4260 domain-containing protein n=1 Tax=Halodurantibacterium flavum TaxID=1382802 RepID=A0ABW4S070_9RHOB